MIAPGRGGLLLAILVSAGLPSCDTSKGIFPPNGSIRIEVKDSGLVFQGSSPPGFQVATFVVESATVEIDGRLWDFLLGNAPCVYSDNVLTFDELERTCRGSGLVVDPGPRRVTVHLRIASILLRRAIPTDLPPEGDNDHDGIINRNDNCPLTPNPAQEDQNSDGIGDACTIIVSDIATRDLDGDGVADVFDSCIDIPNADQADVVRGADLIGDACEQFTNVDLPEGSLDLTFPVDLSIGDAAVSVLTFDFNDRLAFDCDASFTACRVNPSGIQFSVQ